MKNIVICAYKGVGKTTLAEKILKNTNRHVFGFFTRKFQDRIENGLVPVYIFPADSNPIFDNSHLVGMCGSTKYANSEVFEDIGLNLLTIPPGLRETSLIIMDEVGFFEKDAPLFRRRVLECLKGNIPTIVMMKQKMNEPFMQEIKSLAEIEFIEMDEQNRDSITDYIINKIKELDL